MAKRWRVLLFVATALAALLTLLAPALLTTRADDPPPSQEYGGLDDIYIASGWTSAYRSKALVTPPPPVRPKGELNYHVFLPLVQNGGTMRETRALWVTRWDFSTPSQIQYIVDKAAYANMNVILFQVRGQADALYTPGLEPWSAVLAGQLGQDPGWDPLQEMITCAHAKGLEVHAWLNAYPAWISSTAPLDPVTPRHMYHDFSYHYDSLWIQWSQAPHMPMPLSKDNYLFANPAYPAVQDRIVAVCADIANRYAIDGIHFDYIRYADPVGQYSYDPYTQQQLAANPSLNRGDYQRAQVTALLQRVRAEVLAQHPGLKLTATAWPIYQTHYTWFPYLGGYDGLYQDSHGWARTGLTDGIMPMLYTQSVHDYRDRFAELTQDHVNGSAPGRAIIGIEGDYSSFEEIAWRIEKARELGASGQALFSYRLLDERSYWQALRDGPYRQAAVPNWP